MPLAASLPEVSPAGASGLSTGAPLLEAFPDHPSLAVFSGAPALSVAVGLSPSRCSQWSPALDCGSSGG